MEEDEVKKFSLIVLAGLLIFSLVACKGKSQSSTGGGKPIIGLSLQNMDTTLAVVLFEQYAAALRDEYDVQVASADNDPNRQITQIENFITMGVKMIVTMPIEMSGLAGSLKKATQAGILVYSIGADPHDDDAVSSMTLLNQYLTAQYCMKMAKEWVEETFPNAPDGSVEMAIFADTSVTELIDRLKAYHQVSEPYLKNVDGQYINYQNEIVSEAQRVANPIYCPAVKLLPDVEAPFLQSGITAMQNLLVSNPNVRVIMGINTNSAIGASQAIMDDYNKGAGAVVKDLSKIAAFGVSVMELEEEALKDSAAGDGVLRGAIAFGGTDLVGVTLNWTRRMLTDPNCPKVDWIEISKVTVVNGERVDEPLDKDGALQP
ncbi:MAG: substrate-binding domain-containing protein [Treponema sp.]|jgi:ABC-type sugar transport system substrate-binding protein|nr:substrate-binding domain-containing protein [Treponema sp.]